MRSFTRGPFRVRLAEGTADIQAAQRLRYHTFIEGTGAAERDNAIDSDQFDPACDHVMIELIDSGALICCFRLLPLADGSQIDQCYSAQFYNLSNLRSFPSRMVEMGRFCVHPEHRTPHVLRLAWSAMSRYVDENKVELLFGCSSFAGNNPDEYKDSFAYLRERHLAPSRWLPRVKAPKVFRFAKKLSLRPDNKAAMTRMPPLLRGYLSLGGWVSDHAVIDEDMNTLHVFTGVEISRVPNRIAKLIKG